MGACAQAVLAVSGSDVDHDVTNSAGSDAFLVFLLWFSGVCFGFDILTLSQSLACLAPNCHMLRLLAYLLVVSTCFSVVVIS